MAIGKGRKQNARPDDVTVSTVFAAPSTVLTTPIEAGAMTGGIVGEGGQVERVSIQAAIPTQGTRPRDGSLAAIFCAVPPPRAL